jgi:hypothetical protein
MLTVVAQESVAGAGTVVAGVALASSSSLLDEIVRDGARRMLAAASAYIAAFADERDEAGHRLVVRNGSHAPRQVLTSAGSVPVECVSLSWPRLEP